MVRKTKVDSLLSLLNEKGVVTRFSVVEVPGPGSVVNANHFLQDKKKVAKNFKLLLNKIYRLNVKGGSNIKKIKPFGVQLYKKEFYLYSLQCVYPKLYMFKEETKFGYPTSPSLFPLQLTDFIANMIKMQSHIESSLQSIVSFLNDDGASQIETYHQDNQYIDSADSSPQKKKTRQS